MRCELQVDGIVDPLLSRLKEARSAIVTTPKDSLGIASTADAYWYIRDELLTNIDKAIELVEKQP